MARRGGGTEVSEAVEHIVDLLRRWAPVWPRRMFSGYGLYRGGVMFGIVVDGALYLKVDEENRAEYDRAGTAPFRYERAGKTIALSYRAVPPEVVDSGDELVDWARQAYEAALRSATRARRPHPRER